MKLQSPGNARRSAADRRQQLVSIAMDLIAAKGFEGLRFQEVAKEAGINNATLFYHFSTKEELIKGVMQHLGEELRRTPGRVEDKPSTAIEELRLEFESIGGLLRERPKLFLVLMEFSIRSLRDPVMGATMMTLDYYWREHLAAVLHQGMMEGSFRRDIDVEAATTAWMAQIKGIGFHALTGKLNQTEVEKCVAEIALEVEHWLTHGKG